MEKQENPPPDKPHPPTWPPTPRVPRAVKTHWQVWSYLTGYRAGDLVLGLVAGAVAHFMSWGTFLLIVGLGARALAAHVAPGPIPETLWYGSWVFAVAAAVLLVCLFFQRYPALMSGFVIGTVPAAAINLFLLWFGAGLAGGAAD